MAISSVIMVAASWVHFYRFFIFVNGFLKKSQSFKGISQNKVEFRIVFALQGFLGFGDGLLKSSLIVQILDNGKLMLVVNLRSGLIL